MTLHLLVVLLSILLLAASLPLTIELMVLSLAALLPFRRSIDVPANGFRLAVLVPAHNEEKLIAQSVRSLLETPGCSAEVYVIAHNCTDRTALLALDAGAHVLPLEGPGGKGAALDYGFQHLLGRGAEAVLVIDADSIVAPNLLSSVTSAMLGGAGAVQARYQVGNVDANFRTRLASLALLGMNVLRPRGRSRLGLSCGIFGNGFALSAATLRAVPYTANSLVEDLEYHLRLVKAGIRVNFLDHTTVFGEMPENSNAARTQRARWEGGRSLIRRQWLGPLLRATLSGRLRFVEPLLDVLALPLASQAGLLVLSLALSLVQPLPWLRVSGLCGLLVTILYVVVAATLSDDPAGSLRALAAAPGYLLWKLLMIPTKRLASRKNAQWVRTERNADAAVEPPPL